MGYCDRRPRPGGGPHDGGRRLSTKFRLTIASVGRFKSGPERAVFEHFRDRLSWELTLREVEVRGHYTEDELIRREAALLAGACPDGAWRIALDAGGKTLSSVEFAHVLSGRRNQGHRDIAFLIGGAEGLDPRLVAGCAMAISFGRATWPHLLVRGMLAEQVYRAQQILNRHPYHHGK